MTQFARPDSDVSVGAWTTSPLFSKVDEVTLDTGDFIQASTAGNECELGLGDVTDPAVGTGHVLSVTFRQGAGASFSVRIIKGTTVIHTYTTTTNTGGGFVTETSTLSEAEANNIDDYPDLRIRLTLDNSVNCRVAQCFFECPDAPAGGTVLKDVIQMGMTVPVAR